MLSSLKHSGLAAAMLLQISLCAQQGTQSVEHKKISVHDYIEKYRDIAIREMERSGIPASITLAQGIFESGFGNSRLAREANNHFGIKCHEWKGVGFYHWDDDPQESCFRVYENADSSYIDHTEFLVGRKRYAFLFEYDRTDYVQWAHGLKKAGYATDPKYPEKLITMIEKYDLNLYDQTLSSQPLAKADLKASDAEVFVVPEDMNRSHRRARRSHFFVTYKKGLYRQNGATYAYLKKDETALEFAKRFDIPYRKFLTFNDLVDGDQLIANQYCYIQPKRSKYKGEEVYHLVKVNETMYEIAQFYGIKLYDLLERNLMSEGQEPLNGEMILLNEKVFKAPKLRSLEVEEEPIVADIAKDLPEPRFRKESYVSYEKEELIADKSTYPSNIYNPDNVLNTSTEELEVKKSDPVTFEFEPIDVDFNNHAVQDKKTESSEKTYKPVISKDNYIVHVVQSGESLYVIGKRYNVDWEEIKSFNGLNSIDLILGQTLKIPK